MHALQVLMAVSKVESLPTRDVGKNFKEWNVDNKELIFEQLKVQKTS